MYLAKAKKDYNDNCGCDDDNGAQSPQPVPSPTPELPPASDDEKKAVVELTVGGVIFWIIVIGGLPAGI